MRRFAASFSLVALFCAPAGVMAEPVLEKVVIFSRHGIRSPTNQNALNPLSIDAWPSWPVPDGELTPHGAAAARLMGQYFRSLYTGSQFLNPSACPKAPDDVFAWADKSERTRSTANAMLAGMFPGCGLSTGFNTTTANKLFHPIEAGIAPLDPKVARAAVLEAMGGSQRSAKRRYAADFSHLATVLRGPTSQACMKAGLRANCRLIDLPWRIRIAPKEGNYLTLKGPLADASTVGEVIRLEYSDGMPLDQVGWGRIRSPADVTAVLSLHKALYDVTLRVPYIAKRGASQILNQISIALRQGTNLIGAGEGPPASKVLLMVGHDSNIATMQAALGVHWQVGGYPVNDTPPGGAIVFERWRERVTEERSVRAYYIAQTLDQMRNLIPPIGGRTPPRVGLTLPGCIPAEEKMCALQEFIEGLGQVIDKSATSPVPYVPTR